MSGPDTIQEARAWGSRRLREQGIERPGLTADLLLAHCLDVSRLELPLLQEEGLTEETRRTFQSLVRERMQRRPLEYITGQADFFGRTFHVDERALIPRPETERLVECVLSRLAERRETEAEGRSNSACDLGVGSGVILLTLCLERPEMQGIGVDISSGAIELARENAREHGLESRVDLVAGDFLEPDTMDGLVRKSPFDVVVSNPPYVLPEQMDELQPEVRDHEPTAALKTPIERTQFYRKLIERADRLTGTGGIFAMEMSETGHPDRERIKERTSFSDVIVEQDHRGTRRLLLAEKR